MAPETGATKEEFIRWLSDRVRGQGTRGTQATSRWFLLSRLASRRVAVHETWRTTGGWGSPSSRGESCENSPQLYRGEKTPKPHRVSESFFGRYGGINCGPVFYDWAFRNGQKAADELDYVPLPAKVVEQVEASWKANIQGKLNTLDDIYRFAVEQASISRGQFLELIVVLILVLELVLLLLGVMK